MGRIIQWVLLVKRRPICSRIAVWFTRPWTATRWSSRVRRGSRILFAEIARKWKNKMQKGVSQQDDTVKHERLRIEVYDLAAEHWGVTGTLPIKFGFIGMASQIIQPKIYPCWTQCWILVIYMIKIYFLKSVKRANSCQWVMVGHQRLQVKQDCKSSCELVQISSDGLTLQKSHHESCMESMEKKHLRLTLW